MKIIIDSSAFISLLAADQYANKQATKFFDELKDQNARLYTSNLILSESYTWLLYKNGLKIANGLKDMVELAENEGLLEIFWIDDLLSRETWTYFVKFAEHKLSFTDAFSYLLVKKFKLDSIFTFDEGFKKVGLLTKP